MKKIFLALTLLLFVTCKKNETTTTSDPLVDEAVPVASFTMDKSECDAGDVIKVTNASSIADNIRWTLPDGSTSKESTVSFTVNPNIGNTTINVKLEAISKSGLKSDFMVKGIKVNPGKGVVTLYSNLYTANNIYITIDGIQMSDAAVDKNKAIPSNCSESGYTSYTVIAGYHSLYYYSYNNGNTLSGTKNFTIATGGCVKLNCN